MCRISLLWYVWCSIPKAIWVFQKGVTLVVMLITESIYCWKHNISSLTNSILCPVNNYIHLLRILNFLSSYTEIEGGSFILFFVRHTSYCLQSWFVRVCKEQGRWSTYFCSSIPGRCYISFEGPIFVEIVTQLKVYTAEVCVSVPSNHQMTTRKCVISSLVIYHLLCCSAK